MESFALLHQISPPNQFWCHNCQKEVQTRFVDEFGHQCDQCQGFFCEAIENQYDEEQLHPQQFQPFQIVQNESDDSDNTIQTLSLENSAQRDNEWARLSPQLQQQYPINTRLRGNGGNQNPTNHNNTMIPIQINSQNIQNSNRTDRSRIENVRDVLEDLPLNLERGATIASDGSITSQALQNSELLRTILDMALQRIRNNNSEFNNAVLTRAQIRVIGNNAGPSQFRLRRLFPDFGSLYNNSPQGIYQDLIEDYLDRPEFPMGFGTDLIKISRFGTPPASKLAIQALKNYCILDFKNSNTECCVCQELFKDYEPDTTKLIIKQQQNQVVSSDSDQQMKEPNEQQNDQQNQEVIKVPKILEMPCTHMFHDECLIPWLEKHNSCPTCRFELPTEDNDYEQRKIQQRNRQSQNINNNNAPISTSTTLRGINGLPLMTERGVGHGGQNQNSDQMEQ
ncbi:ring finger protein [Stylonychia lemnae]|uniref:Ring finger protein n=1 Tax=Stylonychia lemnae TaxID=5949 RepID=A0A078AXJ7_STYLE|nr:ring finger protein [Stylonychia lemnae]|eukprot:CDW86796.1 ring finger protein [Stylonychia lemnae]